MGDRSAIEWTDATWNPVTGCSHVSDGCKHCYAEALSLRMGWSAKPWTAANAGENVVLHPKRLEQPLHWRKPRMIFVNSMSDLFHELIPDGFITLVFDTMCDAKQHTFQVLTKRPERMLEWFRSHAGHYKGEVWPLPNVWLGVSVENQREADRRIPLLLQMPSAVRFLSCEPLLGPLDLVEYLQLTDGNDAYDEAADGRGWGYDSHSGGFVNAYTRDSCYDPQPGIHWVICGGESGAYARPMHPAWALSLRDQCRDADVPFFFKQWGGRTPKAGGRLLDGRTWDEMPERPQMVGAHG